MKPIANPPRTHYSRWTMNEFSETASGPVDARARIRSIDTLRGVALLGILLMNIIAFGLPYASYFDPTADGSLEGLNLTTYMTMDILVEGSMRAIFSMLFGAGMLIFVAKPEVDVAEVKTLFYRRTTLLILFGAVNAYLLVWVGDILFAYGVAGLLLYLFRDFSASRLATYGLIVLGLLSVLHTSMHFSTRELREEVLAIEALPAGMQRSAEQREVLAEWNQLLDDQYVSPVFKRQELELRRSDYFSIVAGLAAVNFSSQTLGLLGGSLWDVLAMMMFGMAFMKWGLFDASRSLGFYGGLMLLGFGIGLPVNYWEVITYVDSDFELYWSSMMRPSYDIGRMFVALGYIGLVMVICKSGVLGWLQSALAAVGRMALSNYLAHSIICNVIFMGFGFGLVGELERFQIYYVVLGIWIFQLVVSPIWLRHFHFGPAEWLWRSLTYKQKQAFRR